MSLLRHRTARALSLLSVLALLAVCWSSASGATAPKPTRTKVTLAGFWTGTYSGPYNGTFLIHWKQVRSKLTGTIKLSSPSGTYGITGKVQNGAISFGAVDAGATYTGTWKGKSMSGKYHTAAGDGSWSAHKVAGRG
jgi:hypothetical protein